MIHNRRQEVDYTVFLPIIAAAVREKKEDKDTQLTDAEFKAMVSILYRDAVIAFMKESKLFRIEIPIDIYAGVRRYDIIPPDGYYVESAIRLRTGRRNVPRDYALDEHELILSDSCCPTCDVDEAFWVEVALVPNVTDGQCKFDADFVNRYYEAIKTAMEMRLYAMNRTWFNPQLASLREHQYRILRNAAIRGGTDNAKSVKLRYRRISDAMCV